MSRSLMNRMRGSLVMYSCVAAFVITVGILLLLYAVKGYAPFGGSSMAWMDGNIQYLDFFSYLKRVIAGEDSFAYTFGKTLGGSNVAVLSYYLLSPLNVLVLLFEQTQLHTYFDVLVALKLGLASTTCCYFIWHRFGRGTKVGVDQQILVVLLSVGYGLSHYTLTQASNIMWLDAVYCLPLMLLGVYRVVQGQRGTSLAVWTAYAVFCNWYAGAINCIFACIWWVWETVVRYLDEEPGKPWPEVIRRTLCSGIRYAYLMGTGVLLTCVVFFPTVKVLQNGNRGALELGRMLHLYFVGELPSVIQNNVIGYMSSLGQPSLFCGWLALVGCVAGILYRNSSWEKRVAYGGMLLFTVLLLYWNPFSVVFSLFKDVGSYWYRYSYVCIFVVVFLAAQFFLCYGGRAAAALVAKTGLGLAAVLVMMFYLREGQKLSYTYFSAIALCVGAVALGVWYGGTSAKLRVAALSLAVAVVAGELTVNAYVQMDQYHTASVAQYQSYVVHQRQQLDQLKDQDPGTYRISQTTTRGMNPNGLTAFYNEGLSLGYWSISGYTSSPDDIQRTFLDRLGYPINGENMCIVNTSILGADALLGVKYVLSPYAINGLELRDELETQNGKQVYENPYALPMAFVFEGDIQKAQEGANPFEYQNQLYSQLMGEPVTVYVPLTYTVQDVAQGQRTYTVQLPQGDYGVYANFPWQFEQWTQVYTNGKFSTDYSCWLSPSVVYVPTHSGDTQAVVELKSENFDHMSPDTAQFYALDLQELERVTQTLGQGAVDSCDIRNGYARVEVEAQGDGQLLYLSIPYDKGWTVKRNGEPVEPQLLGDCMYVIPLVDGGNTIEMNYQIPGLKAGAALTLVGVAMLAGYWMANRRKKDVCVYFGGSPLL